MRNYNTSDQTIWKKNMFKWLGYDLGNFQPIEHVPLLAKLFYFNHLTW